MIATLHREGIFPYFVTFVDADEKNSTMNIPALYQSGLGMGDRDYYLSEESKEIKDAYKEYIRTLFTLVGYSAEQADEAVKAVLKIEDKIADASYSREVLRDSHKNYNKMTGTEWVNSNGLLDWNIYFDTFGVPVAENIVVKQTGFFNDLAKAMKDVTLDEQKALSGV